MLVEVLGYPDGMKIVFMDSVVLSIPLLIPTRMCRKCDFAGELSSLGMEV